MDLSPCSWRQVVAAIKRCCSDVQILDRDEHVAIGKIPFIFTISKAGLVPVEVQARMLEKLGITRVEYLSFLPDPPTTN